jgi:minor extracellular protease Epr
VDFAATGSGLEAAKTGGGYGEVRGTSFATPIVAALLATALESPDAQRARRALDALASGAIDLGNNGVDPTYGKGLVGIEIHPGLREEIASR